MKTERIDMQVIADDVARALASARVRGASAFISTAVRYPNGSSVIVRLDEHPDGFFVSDDGYAAVLADMMGVPREGLSTCVSFIANASSRSVERTIYAQEHIKIKRSRDVFNNRLIEAYGDKVSFDVSVIGGTGRSWEYEAAIVEHKRIEKLFTLVSPAFNAVAAANLKISDTRTAAESPQITAALSDYDRTEPALRSLLSASADLVIAANDEAARYRLAA